MAAEAGSHAASVQEESGALPQPRQLQDSVDNPFVVGGTATETTARQNADNGGGNDSSAPLQVPIPAGRNQPPPPAYTEAFRRSGELLSTNPTCPLVKRIPCVVCIYEWSTC